MSDMKKKEQSRQTRTQRELERLESSESGSRQPKPKPKPKPKEKTGMGEASYDSVTSARIAMLRRKLAALKDPAVKEKLRQEIQALQTKK